MKVTQQSRRNPIPPKIERFFFMVNKIKRVNKMIDYNYVLQIYK